MKKLFNNISMFMLLILLGGGLQSCSDNLQDAGDVKVSFIATLPTDVCTRSYGDAGQINTLVAGVFLNDVEICRKTYLVNGNIADVQFSLAKNQSYDFVFWAYDNTQDIYDISDLTAIRMVELPDEVTFAQAESMDAFFATEKGMMVMGDRNCLVELVRPLAQINVGTSEAVVRTSFTVKGAPDTFYPFTGIVSGETDYTWNFNETTSEVFSADGADYSYLSLSYVFAPAAAIDISVELTLTDEVTSRTVTIPKVEIEANKRTNIAGRITAAVQFPIDCKSF